MHGRASIGSIYDERSHDCFPLPLVATAVLLTSGCRPATITVTVTVTVTVTRTGCDSAPYHQDPR